MPSLRTSGCTSREARYLGAPATLYFGGLYALKCSQLGSRATVWHDGARSIPCLGGHAVGGAPRDGVLYFRAGDFTSLHDAHMMHGNAIRDAHTVCGCTSQQKRPGTRQTAANFS